MNKILITGIPGSSKTTVGNYLQDYYQFVHFDFEEIETLSDFISNREMFIKKLEKIDKAVITWGFPVQCIEYVNFLKKCGFLLFWFDGDRALAYEYWKRRELIRGNTNTEPFYIQIRSIDHSNVIESIKPTIINPFLDRKLRGSEDVVSEILKIYENNQP